MIRIISFRGTAAKLVITYSSITGGKRIPSHSTLQNQSLSKINVTYSSPLAVCTYVWLGILEFRSFAVLFVLE